MELDRKIGEFVINSKNCEVSLEKYDVEIGIEILKDSAFVFTQRIPCLGGLPLGVSGVAVSLIQDASDLVASWLMMKRGVLIYPVSQGNPDISILRKYCYGYQMSLHKSNTLQDIQSYMNSLDAKALVVGQTLKNFAGLQTDRLVLRPLIGYDQNQIKELYDKIK
jgi:adenylyl- and sulfurtransferase ThiI